MAIGDECLFVGFCAECSHGCIDKVAQLGEGLIDRCQSIECGEVVLKLFDVKAAGEEVRGLTNGFKDFTYKDTILVAHAEGVFSLFCG
jgi:hypothetical protein